MQDNIPKPALKNKPTVPSIVDLVEPPPRKLLDRFSDAIRMKHYSYQTQKSYVQRIKPFILFHNKQQYPYLTLPDRHSQNSIIDSWLNLEFAKGLEFF